MREDVTIQDYGTLGASQPQGTDICVIPTPGPGRWKIWGQGRHTVIDGLRLLVGSTIIIQLSAGANASQSFGPIVLDITNNTDNIVLELAVATGGSDSASGTLFAQKLSR